MFFIKLLIILCAETFPFTDSDEYDEYLNTVVTLYPSMLYCANHQLSINNLIDVSWLPSAEVMGG